MYVYINSTFFLQSSSNDYIIMQSGEIMNIILYSSPLAGCVLQGLLKRFAELCNTHYIVQKAKYALQSMIV